MIFSLAHCIKHWYYGLKIFPVTILLLKVCHFERFSDLNKIDGMVSNNWVALICKFVTV